MARKFDIPEYYRSSIISTIKNWRRSSDHRKKDLTPALLDLGAVRFKLARHFGFCFGVENAIEIAYRALKENPEKRVFLLSEMIHNPHVNSDLASKGVKFILAPDGAQLIPFESLKAEDIVIVPAFGTTVELFEKLRSLGLNPLQYNATCPFVEKVWARAEELAKAGYTIVVHGKHSHEETRATVSHARLFGRTITIRDMKEAQLLAEHIKLAHPISKFEHDFQGRYSPNFNPLTNLERIGVVNQTTMLATETQEISNLLKQAMLERYGHNNDRFHFADTRDTLCYATSENQQSVYGLIESGGDIAIVVGGYNSSNTSHLVELCADHMPTYYIKDCDEILSRDQIRHLNLDTHSVLISNDWLPTNKPKLDILLTAGASCPDALVDLVVLKIASFFNAQGAIEPALKQFQSPGNLAVL